MLKLLPALVTSSHELEIGLTQVFTLSQQKDMSVLKAAKQLLINKYKLSNLIKVTSIRNNSVSEGVINLVNTQGFDLVVLGASGEGMLQQAMNGNIPEAIASGVDCTVILVRGMIGYEL